jgi:hypothetical protein
MTLDEAQQLDDVMRRPSYLQRYPGPGAPLQAIVGIGRAGPVGRFVHLACGHWREITSYDLMPVMGRKQPVSARCGLCRDGVEP